MIYVLSSQRMLIGHLNKSIIELRPMRQRYQESLPEYEAKKRDYDAQVVKIENTISSVIGVSILKIVNLNR